MRPVAHICCLLVLCIMPGITAGDDGALIDSLLTAAADEGREFDARKEDLEEAAKRDRSGRTMHALARLYLGAETISARDDAGRWLRRAMEKEPESAEYRSTYAELLWASGQRQRAYEAARKAHELDPDNVRALYYAGRYAVWSWEMSHWTDMAGGVDADVSDRSSGHTIRQLEYEDIDLSVGEEFLNRAIALDPGHRAARVLLGVVYHETKRPTHLVKLFEEYQRAHPDDRDAPFFIGLGYQSKGDLKAALQSYAEGLSRLSEGEVRLMQSAVMLVQREDEPLPDREALERFWLPRDPVFLTPVNERLMAHCSRVAYANLRYGDPRRGIEGWKTDRGQAHVRYGQPLARQMSPADVDVGLDASPEAYDAAAQEVERTGRMPYRFRHRAETWGYDGFELTFLNTATWDSWRFGQGIAEGRRTHNYGEFTRWVPEYYSHPHQYPAPCQVAQFRGEAGKTRVELYYGLEADRVESRDAGSGVRSVAAQQGLFLFDTEWDPVQRDVTSADMLPWVVDPSSGKGYLLCGEHLTLDPGTYHLGAEAEDQKTGTAGTVRDTVQVRAFGVDTLEVSDVLLARRVVERRERPFGRGRYMVLPNPLKQCRRDGHVALYFEVYNLTRDAFGATRYRVTYQIRALPETEIERRLQPEWTTAVTNTYDGSRAWEPHHLRLDMAGSVPGPWGVRVEVVDLLGGQRVGSETSFRVKW